MQVTYHGCVLYKTMLGEPMTIEVIKKNGKLRLLNKKNRDLIKELCGFLCYVLIRYILIMPAQAGTLISMKKQKRKYK